MSGGCDMATAQQVPEDNQHSPIPGLPSGTASHAHHLSSLESPVPTLLPGRCCYLKIAQQSMTDSGGGPGHCGGPGVPPEAALEMSPLREERRLVLHWRVALSCLSSWGCGHLPRSPIPFLWWRLNPLPYSPEERQNVPLLYSLGEFRGAELPGAGMRDSI